MSNKIIALSLGIIAFGAGTGILIQGVGHGHDTVSVAVATTTPSGLPEVSVMKPATLRADGSAESTYFGEVLSDLDGQIFAFREGLIERLYVDLGSYVRKGQPVALLSAGEFTPEYASMLAEREEMVVRARAMVAAAESNLKSARDLGAQGANATVEVVTQQKMVANAQRESDSMIAVEQERVIVRARKVDAEIRNTYAVLQNIFYSAGVPQSSGASWQVTSDAIGTLNPQAVTDLNASMASLRKVADHVPAADYAEAVRVSFAALTSGAKALDATPLTSDYSQSMMTDDRGDLNMARRELSSMWNEYNEQLAMVKKTTVEGQARVSDAEQMLGRMQADGDKMLIIARADLAAALRGRSIIGAASGNRMVVAPFSGYLTQRLVNVGQKISMDTPLFAIVQDARGKNSGLFVRFEVPESELTRFQKGDAVAVVRTQNPLQELRATVERVGVGVNVITRAVQIEARLVNPPADILAHATVRVTRGTGVTTSVVIPRDTVITNTDGTLSVFLVRDGIVKSQIIQAGRVIADRVVVTQGLTPDDQVVMNPRDVVQDQQATAIAADAIKIEPTDTMPDGHGAH